MDSRYNMQGKICIVTGANSGIGKAAALKLLKNGATVIMVCRSKERGQFALEEISKKSKNPYTRLMIADLSSQKSTFVTYSNIRDTDAEYAGLFFKKQLQ